MLSNLHTIKTTASVLVTAILACTPIGPEPGQPTTEASETASTATATSTSTATDGDVSTLGPHTTSDPAAETTAGPDGTDTTSATSSTSSTSAPDEMSTTPGSSADTEPSETTTDGDACQPDPGTAMGPCRTEDDPNGTCDPDLLCHLTPDGSFCQPTCASCGSAEHDACIDALSSAGRFTCFAGQGCALPCATDDQCAEPLVCAEDADGNRSCVWPGEPTGPGTCSHLPGALFGPCVDGFCGAGNCLPTESGDMCVPDCETCEDAGNIACSADLTTTDDVGLLCHSIAPGCSVPCVFTSPTTDTCDGGTVCDPHFGVCVWP